MTNSNPPSFYKNSNKNINNISSLYECSVKNIQDAIDSLKPYSPFTKHIINNNILLYSAVNDISYFESETDLVQGEVYKSNSYGIPFKFKVIEKEGNKTIILKYNKRKK